MKGPITIEELVTRLQEMLLEIANNGEIWQVEKEPAGQIFLLVSPSVGGKVLGLYDCEYGWPAEVNLDKEFNPGQLTPGSRSHRFLFHHGRCVAVALAIGEYKDIQKKHQISEGPMPAKVTLKVTKGKLQSQEFVFAERTTCIVGRDDDCQPRLPNDEDHNTISRNHCLLDINPPDIRVRDFGSRNGTFVNGTKIGQREAGQTPEQGAQLTFPEHDLKEGDEIEL